MVKIISLILLISSCHNGACDSEAQEIAKTLNVLNTKKILELSSNELNLIVPMEYEEYLQDEITVNGRQIELHKNKKSVPRLQINNVFKKDGLVDVKFNASESAYRYKGEIVFECTSDKLAYKDVHYLTEID